MFGQYILLVTLKDLLACQMKRGVIIFVNNINLATILGQQFNSLYGSVKILQRRKEKKRNSTLDILLYNDHFQQHNGLQFFHMNLAR